MDYEVSLEGSFVTEIKVSAANEKEAEVLAKRELDKLIGLSQEDYVVSLTCVGVLNG